MSERYVLRFLYYCLASFIGMFVVAMIVAMIVSDNYCPALIG